MSGSVFVVGNATTVSRENYAVTLLHRSETAVGNISTGEDDLHSFSVPASTLAAAGDRLIYDGFITFAANNNNKRLRVRWGTDLVLDTGIVTYNTQNAWIHVEVIRTGATTQLIPNALYLTGGTANSLSATSGTQTLSGAITFKVTSDSTATDDIRQLHSAMYFVTPRD